MMRLASASALAALVTLLPPATALAAGTAAPAASAASASPAPASAGAAPASASAINPKKTYVLTLDTDDADEQAEALSAALRSRVRTTQGADALGETPSSLAMLTEALRCPPSPDQSCLNKIADTLKTNRFLWGKMSKGPKGQVSADLHLYVRKQPDVSTHEVYSDNLKESNDETLRVLAGKMYDRLTGVPSSGTLHVHAGEGDGSVFVDGERKTKLVKGVADLDLSIGTHAVEVRVPGSDPMKQQVDVVGGQTATFDPLLAPAGTSDTSSIPVRRIVAYGAIGAGVVMGVISAIFVSKYSSAASDSTSDRKLYSGAADCSNHGGPASAACNDESSGKSDSAVAWTTGAVGVAAIVTGIVLIETEPKTEKASARRWQILPDLSPRSTGMTVVGTF